MTYERKVQLLWIAYVIVGTVIILTQAGII